MAVSLVHVLFREGGNGGCRVRCQRGAVGWMRVSISLRFSEMWLGRIKAGGRCLLWEEAMGGRDLSGVLSQATKSICITTDGASSSPRAFF